MAENSSFLKIKEDFSRISRQENKSFDEVVMLLKELRPFKKIYDKIEKLGTDFNEIIEKLRLELIPASIFSKELSSLESIAKYCVENLGMRLKDVALITNRSNKTIWQAYSASKKKSKEKLVVASSYYFPLSLLGERRYSVLESIVVYLKDNLGLRYCEIARLLHRNDRTVWATYQNAKKKKTSRKA